MRASRLLSIVLLLQSRGRVTAETLAREFGVTVRTIYRDIDALSAAQIPTRSVTGPGGGIELLAGYRTRLTGFGSDEAQALFLTGLPGPAAALGLGPAVSAATRKLLAALPSQSASSAARIGERFHLDAVDWYRSAEPVPQLQPLAQAVFENLQVQMSYSSWTATREWRIEPLGLVLKAGHWYVVANGRGKLRVFKVANIIALKVSDEHFERPKKFDLAERWQAELARFESGLRPNWAQLRATETGCKRLAALGDFAARAVATRSKVLGSKSFQIRLPFENVEHAALQLMGLGPELEVLAPLTLRQQIRSVAQTMAKLHRRQ